MKLQDLDNLAHEYGAQPLRESLQWLETLTRSPAVRWEPGQRAAAVETLHAARALLDSDLLQVAARAVEARRAANPVAQAVETLDREPANLLPVGTIVTFYQVPYHAATGFADWDRLRAGTEPPYGLSPGWAWKRVFVIDAAPREARA